MLAALISEWNGTLSTRIEHNLSLIGTGYKGAIIVFMECRKQEIKHISKLGGRKPVVNIMEIASHMTFPP